MWFVSMFMACELTSRYVAMTLFDDVLPNIVAPWSILLNLIKNMFNIMSDIFVVMTDFYYEDYYSMYFWFGDIFYQLMVISPYESDYEYYQGNDPDEKPHFD